MRIWDMGGQIIWILCRDDCLLRELKAFEASTRSAPWTSSSLKNWRIAWIAASQPPSWPAQTWRGPAASCISYLKRLSTALAIILLGTSPTPIGLTPGHLFNGINRQATKALRLSGWILQVQILWPTAARTEQRSWEADLKEEHSLLQAKASRPERSLAPWVCKAA